MNKLMRAMNEDLFGSSNAVQTHEKLIIQTVIKFMNAKFGINPKITVKKKNSTTLIGDVIMNTNSLYNNKFTVHFNPKMSYVTIIQALFHELTHVKQMSKGELGANSNWDAITWMGKEYITVTDYNKLLKGGKRDAYVKLPWEVEAIKNQHDSSLFNQWLKSPFVSKIRNKDVNVDFILDNL